MESHSLPLEQLLFVQKKSSFIWGVNKKKQHCVLIKMAEKLAGVPTALTLTLLHSERPKLYRVLAVLSARGLKGKR